MLPYIAAPWILWFPSSHIPLNFVILDSGSQTSQEHAQLFPSTTNQKWYLLRLRWIHVFEVNDVKFQVILVLWLLAIGKSHHTVETNKFSHWSTFLHIPLATPVFWEAPLTRARHHFHILHLGTGGMLKVPVSEVTGQRGMELWWYAQDFAKLPVTRPII